MIPYKPRFHTFSDDHLSGTNALLQCLRKVLWESTCLSLINTNRLPIIVFVFLLWGRKQNPAGDASHMDGGRVEICVTKANRKEKDKTRPKSKNIAYQLRVTTSAKPRRRWQSSPQCRAIISPQQRVVQQVAASGNRRSHQVQQRKKKNQHQHRK